MGANKLNQLLRVTQLDAQELDEEIGKILKLLMENATKYLTPGAVVPYEPEINYILKLLTLKYSVLNNDATFGQKLMLIKYKDMTVNKKIMYVILSSFSYLKERIDCWQPTRNMSRFVHWFDGLCKVLSFVNLSVFLLHGIKPNLIDRVVGLEQIYERNVLPRNIGNKYLTRELLWNGFIELLMFVIPLINYHKLKRMLLKTYNPFYARIHVPKSERRAMNLFTKCSYCGEYPTQPHHMGCTHVFCYVCLKGNQLADNKFECPSCDYSGEICERVNII